MQLPFQVFDFIQVFFVCFLIDFCHVANFSLFNFIFPHERNSYVVENLWQCVCGEEWLADWLSSIGDRDVLGGSMGCIRSRVCDVEDTNEEEHRLWITVIASVFAVVSLVILIAIALLYVEDGKFCLFQYIYFCPIYSGVLRILETFLTC